MNRNNLILTLLFFFFLFPFSFLLCIEVGGHITEDTTWSPENNPYFVTQNIYVDEGVTLTILPGTEIKLRAAEFTEYNYNTAHLFNIINGESVAKMFWVNGRIIAEGTEQDSIIFTRIQDSLYYHWGTIYLSPEAELSRFKYCRFEYSAIICIELFVQPAGAINITNGKTIIENCYFIDNLRGIGAVHINYNKEVVIKGNTFKFNQGLHQSVSGWRWNYINLYLLNNEDSKPVLIVENIFIGYRALGNHETPVYFVNNKITDWNHSGIYCGETNSSNYFYNNSFIDCNTGIYGGDSSDSLYIKKNQFINGSYGVDIDEAYVEISDNLFDGCSLIGPSSPYYTKGIIENNIITDSGLGLSGRYEIIQNNIIYNCGVGSPVIGSSDIFRNNLIFGNDYLCSTISCSGIHENNIYLGNEEIFQHIPSVYGNPIFRNCILDFELPPECIDAGGNIWVDSLSADSLFVDWQNGDFHLIEGSLAIDAGFDTTSYYCPFDMDYNVRIWDGDSNGTPIIDIGPYEFASLQLGGICGTVYQTENGEPLDYVLLKINNQPGEFEFSDSLGYFEFRLPAGMYDIYAERVFYDDVVVEDIEVIDGEFTQINFSMEPTVGVDEINPLQEPTVFMNNYPNPFNPSTNISFDISSESDVIIIVYNIKGQKVKQLVSDHISAGQHSVMWNGKDSNNKSVSSGIYFYKISVGKSSAMKKMLLLK